MQERKNAQKLFEENLDKTTNFKELNARMKMKTLPAGEIITAVNEKMIELGLRDYEDFWYCGSSYLCDRISELADCKIDIMDSELMAWLPDNTEWLEQAISEFGWEGCGSNFYGAIRLAQFLAYENEFNEHRSEIIMSITFYTFLEMFEELNLEYLTTEDIIDGIMEVANYNEDEDDIDILESGLREKFEIIEDENEDED